MPRLNLSKVEVKAARVLLGMKGHRPSGFNMCVASKLKGGKFAKPAVGMGGRHNKAVQSAFVKAAVDCGADIGSSARERYL